MESTAESDLNCPICFLQYSHAFFPHICPNCTSRICSKCLLYVDKCTICRKSFDENNKPKKDNMILTLIQTINKLSKSSSNVDPDLFVRSDMKLTDSSLYVGNTKGGVANGQGRLYNYPDSLFVGEFKGGKPTQNGKCFTLVKKGVWKDDEFISN